MIHIKSRLTTKLLLFVITISSLFIGGSITLFYITGRNIVQNSSVKELELYFNFIENSIFKTVNKFSTEINASIIENNFDNENYTANIKILKKLLLNNTYNFQELYFWSKQKKEVTFLTLEKIFTGEYFATEKIVDRNKIDSILRSIKFVNLNFINSKFGNSIDNRENDIYVFNSFDSLNILIKINSIQFYESLAEECNLPRNDQLCITDPFNVIIYSTNKSWSNQNLHKYFNPDLLKSDFNFENNNSFLIGKRKSTLLQKTIILFKDYSDEYNHFINIFQKLLLYSIIIYLVIIFGTLIYSNKISKSLNKVTEVIGYVSDKKFDHQIKIARSDELGLLINSFNKMVVDLDDSYRKLEITNDELNNKIQELVKTKNELTKKEKLALIGETISKISHEIQNKISGVSVWVQNLEMQRNMNDNTKIYVEEIKNSLNSFMEMLLNFKKFYRKPFLEKKNTNITNLIENVLNQYKSDFEAKKIVIEKYLSIINVIYVDENLIEEALTNLFVNAIYYSPQKGKIKIVTENDVDNFKLSVIDEGVGVKEEIIDNIFNPFFTTKHSGSGLGLAITKNIIEAHDGTIEVSNLETGGARFTISFPLTNREKENENFSS
jgi:signal transduction histidine kinase